VCLIVVLNWDDLFRLPSIQLKTQPLSAQQAGWLLGSFALVGVPILEELARTYRAILKDKTAATAAGV
jgi:hypothetical protein